MLFNIDRKNGIPIYIQVKEQIKKHIQQGVWQSGVKLPTERQLAKRLNVSRNTVSAAYKELENEGILKSYQGRGTFVSNVSDIFVRKNRKERLIKIIDKAMEEAIKLGFDLDEFVVLSHIRATAKKEMMKKVKVAFVECNKEQLDYFTKELELGSGVSILPILLEDFKENPQYVNKVLEDVDIIVTTFFHIEEVKKLLDPRSKEVLGIALDPKLETIVKIAKIPKDKKIGLLCISENFAQKVLKSIENAGLKFPVLTVSTNTERKAIKKFVENCDVIIASPSRKKDLIEFVDESKVIEFIYVPDTGSINMLKSALFELKQK